jgi:hypothetical protein
MGHWSSGEDAGFSPRRATVRLRHALLVIAWPRSKAAGCNPAYAGSIPVAVSPCGWRIGRCACRRDTATFATVAQGIRAAASKPALSRVRFLPVVLVPRRTLNAGMGTRRSGMGRTGL